MHKSILSASLIVAMLFMFVSACGNQAAPVDGPTESETTVIEVETTEEESTTEPETATAMTTTKKATTTTKKVTATEKPPAWMERYFEAFWDLWGSNSHHDTSVLLYDLNNDGVLDLIADMNYPGDGANFVAIITMANGEPKAFEGTDRFMFYKHRETGELRIFNRWYVFDSRSGFDEYFIDWKDYTVKNVKLTEADQFSAWHKIGGKYVTQKQYDSFVSQFAAEWEEIQLGRGLQCYDYEKKYTRDIVRAGFMAAMKKMAPNGSINVTPIPGLSPAAQPFEVPSRWAASRR